jgi:single-strand DNA-binding protein
LEIWEGLAKVVEQYVNQGDLIYVEGKIKSNVWQDEQGNNRKKMRIRVTTMTMMPKGTNNKEQQVGNSGGGNNNGGSMQQNSSSPKLNEPDPLSKVSSDGGNDIDDLPF